MGKEVPETESEAPTESGSESKVPTTPDKPGWRRVSTRQWIRDFRDNIAKYQTYPYKTLCGGVFLTFGYYPDMVPQESYLKYEKKHPLATKKLSVDSVFLEESTTASEAVPPTETESTAISTSGLDSDKQSGPGTETSDDLTSLQKNRKQKKLGSASAAEVEKKDRNETLESTIHPFTVVGTSKAFARWKNTVNETQSAKPKEPQNSDGKQPATRKASQNSQGKQPVKPKGARHGEGKEGDNHEGPGLAEGKSKIRPKAEKQEVQNHDTRSTETMTKGKGWGKPKVEKRFEGAEIDQSEVESLVKKKKIGPKKNVDDLI